MQKILFAVFLLMVFAVHAETTDQPNPAETFRQGLQANQDYYDSELQKMQDQLKKMDEARKAKQKAEKARQVAKQKADREKYKAESQKTLSNLDEPTLCLVYGQAVRDKKINYTALDFDGSKPLIINEAKKRRLIFNDELINKQSVRIGDSQCQMYAALGEPERENRTVTSYSTRIQHVYGNRFYVYTENGKVTSWQD